MQTRSLRIISAAICLVTALLTATYCELHGHSAFAQDLLGGTGLLFVLSFFFFFFGFFD